MKNDLNKIIKTLDGFVLCIGISDEIADLIDKNENILNCDILTNDLKKEKNKKTFFNKTININKIRKKYKKKKVDYIICNYDVIKPYIRKFVRNSVYINKNKLYFIGEVDNNLVKNRYKRYDTIIKEYKNIIEIDNSKSKSNFIKEIVYSFIDITSSLIEIIGDVLMG